MIPEQYVYAIVTDDAVRIDGVTRDITRLSHLLMSLARNESTTASNKTIIKDIAEHDDVEIAKQTIAEYLDLLKRLYLIHDTPAYSFSMRSTVRIKQKGKRHFCDPSIPAALLKCTKENLLNDLNTLGFLFEALVERDLEIYGETFGAKLFHYQDYKEREIDAVLELADGNWCGFEIKLGAHQIEQAAKNLLRIKKEFEDDPKAKAPQALCVICGMSSAAYMRPDGVYVVPITALKN